MAVINRCAVGVAPRPPLIAWLQQVSGDSSMSSEVDDHSLYLLPSYEDDDERWQVLEQNYERIFKEELHSWFTEPSLWPSPLSFELFQQWFELRFYDLIEDLGEDEIGTDTIDPEFIQELRTALLDAPQP